MKVGWSEVVNLGNALANLTLFWVLLVVYVALAFRYLPKVYNTNNFFAGYGVALVFCSVGLMTAVARLWEHRFMWPLSSQYASFWVNDYFVLCVVVGLLCLMHRGLPADYHGSTWWPYMAAALAVAAGAGFQFVLDKSYPSNVAWSPTHAAHSFGAVVIFVYVLLRGAPMLFYSKWGFQAFAHGNTAGMLVTTGALLGIAAFFAVGPVLDMNLLHTYPWGAHGPYNWAALRLDHKLTPTNPGWMSDLLKRNAARYLGPAA